MKTSPIVEPMSAEDRLVEAGITLPSAPPKPIGSFANVVVHDGMAWVSGQGPVQADGSLECGKVGSDVDIVEARKHARLVGTNILSALRSAIGSLDRVERVIKLQGLVNCTPDFERHPNVIDGASELMGEVFGEDGVHSRTSYGVASLPNNITVEIDGVFALKAE